MINKKRKGFTIVELVIVIAVIAVLAAVLIPTFSSVINKAKESEAMQEARNKYLEVYTDDIAEDGVLNGNVTGEGYTYETENGKVKKFTFEKNGITVEYNGANDDWTVNGESQGGTCTNGHTPEDDDDNCTTPVKCTVCEAVTTAAEEQHNFTDDWEKDETGHWHVCQNDGCNQRPGFEAHTPGPEATETEDQTCTICEYVITQALGHTHVYNIPGYDGTNHWLECTCSDRSSETAHTAAADDGDCTTAVKCTGCEAVIIAAQSHTNTDGDVKCDNANCKHVMPSLHLPFDNGAAGKVGTATELSTNTCYKNDNFVGPGTGSFSASFWINIGGIGTTEDDPALFTNKDWSSGANFGYLFFVQNKEDGPVLKFNVANSSGTRADEMIWALPTNYAGNWIHVICVVDRVNNTVSVSFGFQTLDVKNITKSYDSTESFGDSGLYIGCDKDGEFILQQDTYMDDFMYFNKALDSDDVAALKAYYDALAGN